MAQHILEGNPRVEISLRRSARARRISLRVSRLDGRVTLTLPKGVRDREGLDFAREKADWLRAQLADRKTEVLAAHGADIPLLGRLHRIAPAAAGRSPRVEGQQLLVPGAPDRVPARLGGYIKERARAELAAASDRYAAALGRSYSSLTLRDTRSRWGSCSSAGGLMYSWRLVMAPRAVMDYVAAHEVAHLAEMNHSQAFWETVEQLYGDTRAPRLWLREEGGDLHRYRFKA